MRRRRQSQELVAGSGASEVSVALSALADPTRLFIVWLLRERELSVGELTAELGLSQGTVSYHLSGLRHARLVRVRRHPANGRLVLCCLDEAGASRLLCGVQALLGVGETSRGE